ncbi:MDR family MFS transporter [Streptomyces sp. WAC06614]|uniref:MDR family MFS transporter n=1 Tax=Streptomyces sp. WAC06614 TaxID=2487416 RepID=UPI00163D1A1E|nr:MDR family MFS transporter [Streptomyces sp. WAC06614]
MPSSERVRLGTGDRLVLTALVLITFVGSMDSTILATALPTIAADLGDLQHLSWVVTSYLLAVTGSALIWGKLGDLLGRKPLLQAGLVLFLVGSVLCSRAQGLPELICFRAVQGVGAGGMWVIAPAVLTGIVGPRERGRYQAYVAGVAAVAYVLGPFLGGLLVEHASWRWTFYLNLPFGLAVIGLLAFFLRPGQPTGHPRIDYWGSLLIAACASGTTLLVTWGGVVFAWSSPPMLLLLAAVVVLAVLLVRVERGHPEPLLPGRVLRERVFRTVAPLTLFFWVVESGIVNYLPLFFQVVRETSPTVSGMMLLPMSLAWLLTYSAIGRAVTRTGRYRHFPVIGAVLLVAGLLLFVALSQDASALAYGAALVVLGVAFGLVSPIALIAAQSACAYEDVGVVTSAVVFFRNLGSIFGAALFGAVLNRRLVDHLVRDAEGSRFTAAEAERIRMGRPIDLDTLTPAGRRAYLGGYGAAMDEVFLTGLAVSLLVLAFACVVPAVPLRRTMTATGVRKDSNVIPSLPAGDDHVREALEVLARGGLGSVRRKAGELGRRYGISLEEIWLLCLLSYSKTADARHLAGVMGVSPPALHARFRSLWRKELLYAGDRARGPTPRGRNLVEGLSATLLEQLSADGSPGPADRNARAPLDLSAHALEILAEGSAFLPRPEPD